MIYFRLPHIPFEPVGGVRTVFDYVLRLNALAGKTVAAVVTDAEYLTAWLPPEYASVPIRYAHHELRDSDTLVCTEVAVADAALYPQVSEKYLLVLNWRYCPEDLTTARLQELGYSKILTNSQFSKHWLWKRFPGMHVTHIPHYITVPPQKQLTTHSRRKPNSFLILNRKNNSHIAGVLAALQSQEHTVTIVNKLHPSELSELYKTHQYFINLGYPEGFCRPAAEALAAGCVVIGFTGGGGDDFMHHNVTCLTAPDGDEPALVHQLHRALTLPAKDRNLLIKNARRVLKSKYSDTMQAQALHKVFHQQLGVPFKYTARKAATTERLPTISVSELSKKSEVLEYQLRQQEAYYQELRDSQLFRIWQYYTALKATATKLLSIRKLVANNYQ